MKQLLTCRQKDFEAKHRCDVWFLLWSLLDQHKHLRIQADSTFFTSFGPFQYFSSLLSQQKTWRKSRRIYLLPASVRCLTQRWWVERRRRVSTHLRSPSRQMLGIFRWLRLYLHFMSRASTALLLLPVKSCPSSVSEDWLLLSWAWDQTNASSVVLEKVLMHRDRPAPTP